MRFSLSSLFFYVPFSLLDIKWDSFNKLTWDGLRGSFAFWVLIFHISQNIDNFQKTDYYYFNLTGYFIGVVGFFILSSFLLTYRLLIEFHDENKSNQIPLIIIKYFIRRFFRIYLPYIFYVSLIKSVSK